MTDLTTYPNEEWRETGVPHIKVSSRGRIKDTWTGNIRKTYLNQQGVVCVAVRHAKQKDRTYVLPVARLVLRAFRTTPTDPTVNTPVHIDKDLTNCHIDNLIWGSLHEAKEYYRS